jgi:hypothetical protein
MSTKNPIKYVRNPNSAEAIEARLNNLPDPTVPTKIQLITDRSVGQIFIDLTSTEVDQRVGYIITGGPHLSRKLVKSIVSRDSKTGRMTMTNYYVDIRHKQWIIIKDFMTRTTPPSEELYSTAAFPRSTYGQGTMTASAGVGAPGENWRNQGRSIDKLVEKQRKIHKKPTTTASTEISILDREEYRQEEEK